MTIQGLMTRRPAAQPKHGVGSFTAHPMVDDQVRAHQSRDTGTVRFKSQSGGSTGARLQSKDEEQDAHALVFAAPLHGATDRPRRQTHPRSTPLGPRRGQPRSRHGVGVNTLMLDGDITLHGNPYALLKAPPLHHTSQIHTLLRAPLAEALTSNTAVAQRDLVALGEEVQTTNSPTSSTLAH